MTREEKYWLNRKVEDDILYKKCTKCKEWFPETKEYFYMHNKSKPEKGFQSECKKCTSKRSLKYINEHWDGFIKNVRNYIRNPKGKAAMKRNQIKQQENRKIYRQNNKDKINQYTHKKTHKKHDITSSEWKSCCEIFEWKCAYCDKTYEENYKENKEQFHKEHVDNDGYLDLRNCVPACKNCNSIKHEMKLDELFESKFIESFTKDKYNKIKWWITEGYKKYIEPKSPYRITRKRNEDKRTYHWELWSIDEKRNFIKCLAKADNKAGLKPYIKEYF